MESDPLKQRLERLSPAKRALLEQRLRHAGIASAAGPSIPRRPVQGLAPMSFAQERLWFLNRLEPDSPAYHEPKALCLRGMLNVAALRQALNAVIQRHETLRTTFVAVDGMPMQRIAEQLTVELPIHDLRAIDAAGREAHARRLIEEAISKPFDLSQDCVLRALLLRLDEQEHIFLVVKHHIASDGWSSNIFWRELRALYGGFSAGAPAQLAQLPIQYADFAAWQRNRLQGEVFASQLAYWTKQLDSLSTLQLPTDRPRAALAQQRAASKSFRLDDGTTDALRALSRAGGATLFMTLSAAFQTLLRRYANQEDIVIGTPIAGRNRAELEGLVGFFANTLVLRTSFAGNPSFGELLARVKETCLDAYSHQELPFERLVEALQPERSLNQNPLFQVTFQLNNNRPSALDFAGLRGEEFALGGRIAKFDLSLTMIDDGATLSGQLVYNTDLFDGATIERMLGHFQILLNAIGTNPDRPIGELPILTEAEKHQLLVEWNDTKADFPNDKCVDQLFEAQVEKTPDAIAVVYGDTRLTYRELNQRANQLARYLQALGVGSEALVGICLERSIEMIVGLLAILKAGGAYLPLDPGYPKERLDFTIQDAQVQVLLTQEKFSSCFSHQTVLCLDRDWQEIGNQDVNCPPNNATTDNLAYVIYTSGSTGRPKGVMIPHRGLVNYLRWAMGAYETAAGNGAPLHSSIGFDLSITSIFTPLLSGRSVVLLPEDQAIEALASQLSQETDFSIIKITPAHLELLSQELPTNKLERRARALIIGGEALTFEQLALWSKHAPGTRLINEYGPTETVVGCCVYEVAPGSISSGPVPIGRPIANTQIYLLDQHLQPVPVGVAAEIYIGGQGVARGYLNRPELTQEKFIANPFSTDPKGRLYKTGDLARYLPDGNIEFIGRIDNQVKIRGFRIELGEIETVIAQHPAIHQSLVLVREDSPANKRIVAYIVAVKGLAISVHDLRSYLQLKLPNYMMPAAFVFLDAFPLTGNGKIDRKALPAPDRSQPELGADFAAPRTAVEETVANIWAEILRVEKVGIHDNFFHLGGHSLLATQVILKVNRFFQSDIPLRKLFESPTIAALADTIQRGLGADHAPPKVRPILPVPRDNNIPLSFAQERLWFLDRLDPNRATYNLPAVFRLTGDLNVHALEQSLNEVVRRHETLRTTIAIVDDNPVQTISPSLVMALTPIDLGDLPENQREAALQNLMREEFAQPFDLSRGPLIRARLWRLAARDHVLVLILHHIVSDGWSMGVLFRELSHLHRRYCAGPAHPLPELPIQYADYSVWQRDWLQGDNFDNQLAYWRNQLDDLSTLQLPTDRPRPTVQTYRGSGQSGELSAQLSEAIKDLGQRQGATLFMTLLASFQALLFRYSGQTNIAVGSPIAGRNRPEIEGLIGFFVNTLVLRSDFAHNPTFTELLRQVRETTLGAYSHQDLPFEKLVEELQPQRNPSISPLFQVMFIVQNSADQRFELEQLAVEPLRIHSQIAKFDLTLTMSEHKGALRASLNYNTDLFDGTTIERMLGHFQILLDAIVANPDRPIGELPILTEAEKNQLLVEWNRNETDYPKDRCIQQLFERQAENQPEAVALVCGDREVSYGELNQRANRLAHYLLKLGVGADTVVGISMERSVDLIVGLLAILKAGAAYLPLDPDYPQERLDFMLDDAQVKVLLTQVKFSAGFDRRTILCLDRDGDKFAAESGSNPPCNITPDNLAYAIYTSGSTGQPKGVEVRHRGVARLLFGVDYVQLDAHQTLLHLASISFDAATFEIWGALLHGAKCVLYPGSLPSTEELGEVLKRHHVTTLWLTAALFNLVINQDANALSEVKQLVIGGEALSLPHVRKALSLLPNTQIVNGYGPTESTTFTCCYPIPRALDDNAASVPIGRPIGNTRVHILDDHLNPVPIGVPGEIHIGGDGLARGYLNHPELTQEKFIADPFTAGAKLYKTGDRARYLPDGNVEFLGRIDNQVKLRGYRIELGEIETVIAQHPSVQQAVVLLREDSPGDKRLVAYFVTADGAALSAHDLRGHAQLKLPDYMVPAAFVLLDSLPLTANGKVDRKALASTAGRTLSAAGQYSAPRDPYETALCNLWSEALHVDRVGIDDDFFALGGHSLLAAKLFLRMDEELGRSLPLSVLFAAPNVRALAEHYRTAAAHQMGSLVTLRGQGNRPPLFAVPGVYGNVLGYADLAQALGPDQPFYGLQSIGLDGAVAPLDSIPAMARLYIDELRSVQPKGPYVLIGACFGASVAYEMTQQLLRAGDQVAFLGLLDPTGREGGIADDETSSPRALKMAGALTDLVTGRLHLYLDELCQLNNRQRIKFIATKLRGVGRSLAQRKRLKGVQRELNQIAVHKANLRALDHYKKTPLTGAPPVVEIFATEGRLQTENWAALCPGPLAFHKVPGKDSGDMISAKNSRKLAPLLALRIANAFAR